MKIEHVAIWTRNIEKLKEFYVEFFNGTCGEKYINPKKGLETYFIIFDDGARLELMQMDSIPSNTNVIDNQYIGIIHIAFLLGKIAQSALKKSAKRFESRSRLTTLSITFLTVRWDWKIKYFHDPLFRVPPR